MKKSIISTILLLASVFILDSCTELSEQKLAALISSRPPAVTMPYDNPIYFPNSIPDDLPFLFVAPPNGELLGTVEDHEHKSGTILLKTDQITSDILAYYTDLLSEASLTNAIKSHSYQVFFPPDESGATFCDEQNAAVFLEIFELDNGSKDVRLHYTIDDHVIEGTTCGQPIFDIENFPFPYLAAPLNSSIVGGGGGGGGSGTDTRQGPMGYLAEIVITSNDSLEVIHNHYAELLNAEGWILLNQSSTKISINSSWDFGFYETRSWLAHLITSVGETSNQYIIRIRAVSP